MQVKYQTFSMNDSSHRFFVDHSSRNEDWLKALHYLWLIEKRSTFASQLIWQWPYTDYQMRCCILPNSPPNQLRIFTTRYLPKNYIDFIFVCSLEFTWLVRYVCQQNVKPCTAVHMRKWLHKLMEAVVHGLLTVDPGYSIGENTESDCNSIHLLV